MKELYYILSALNTQNNKQKMFFLYYENGLYLYLSKPSQNIYSEAMAY